MYIKRHSLTSAHSCPSPNHDKRPENEVISLLIIHNISMPPGQFGGDYIKLFFQNRLPANKHPFFEEVSPMRVSAHLLIERDGTTTQFVPFNLRAWHAGISSWKGRECCNDFSIGIELEGTDDTPYTPIQYEQLVKITIVLMKTYPALTPESITGHEHIAPGRKTDPGPAFNWNHYRSMLAASMLKDIHFNKHK